MKKTVGIVFIYCAAVLIMLSILFLFGVIDVRFRYTTAAIGFSLYVAGTFLTREGKLSPFKVVIVIVALLLILVSLAREVIL
ncbi:MAG: hypothetical protein KAR18_08450 [Spirochaetes bacterium]|nr:hypothetical protein [Spirochaetota bacterium]